jgi:hypothetical protein
LLHTWGQRLGIAGSKLEHHAVHDSRSSSRKSFVIWSKRRHQGGLGWFLPYKQLFSIKSPGWKEENGLWWALSSSILQRKKDHRSFEWPRERGTRRQNHSSTPFECKQMHDLLVIIVLIRIVLIRFSTRNSRYLISEFNKSECALSCISPLDKQYDILSSLETRLNTQWRSFSWIKTNNINSILHDTTPCTLQQIHTHTLQFRSYKQCSEQTMDSMCCFLHLPIRTACPARSLDTDGAYAVLTGSTNPWPERLVDWWFATSLTMASMTSMAIDEL